MRRATRFFVDMPLIGVTGRSKFGADVAGMVGAMRASAFDIHVHAYSRAVAEHGGLPVQLPMGLEAPQPLFGWLVRRASGPRR